MTLKERLKEDIKEAMKAKDALRLSTLRLLTSAIKYKEIEAHKELDDEGVTDVMGTAVKQRRDSIEQYEKAGRTDLAEQEKAELAIIQAYMPEQLGRDQIEAIVKEAAAEVGAAGPKDMGKLMKALMPRLKGKADGKLVNEAVKAILGG
ncbi:MAG: GatB/YqeY domain-containing protein [Nitrospirae bacterium]|nr:GatB/YqeY domain-containing protein [Nitrospirota bacterium]